MVEEERTGWGEQMLYVLYMHVFKFPLEIMLLTIKLENAPINSFNHPFFPKGYFIGRERVKMSYS